MSTPTELSVNRPYRLDYLLILRGILAMTVVMHHYLFADRLNALWPSSVWKYLAPQGSYAVFFFFVISGYLMRKILEKRYDRPGGVWAFYRNRFWRIVPVYYFGVILSLLFTGQGGKLLHAPLSLASSFFFYLDYGGNMMDWNPALWSLSTEMQFYLMAPVFMALWRRLGRLAPAVFCVVALATSYLARAYYATRPETQYMVYTNFEVNIIYFIAGWVSYDLGRRVRVPPFAAMAVFLLSLMALWVYDIACLPRDFAGIVHSGWYFYVPLFVALTGVLFMPSLDAAPRGFWAGPLFFLGVTSFAIYVIHFPLRMFVTSLTSLNMGAYAVLWELPVLYLISWGVYKGVEEAFLRYRQGESSRRPQIDTAPATEVPAGAMVRESGA